LRPSGGGGISDPTMVAENLVQNLEEHWKTKDSDKPKLLIIQGNPLDDRGISAITPRVADMLGISRALICLDVNIADYHCRDANRSHVSMDFRYSDFVKILEDGESGRFESLEQRINQYLAKKNEQREQIGKSPLKAYLKDFALLQDVTKAACRQICGEITVAHTQIHINEFSVTSFYTAGIEPGLLEEKEMVYCQETFNFDEIDKR
jgi:hypothetical protein